MSDSCLDICGVRGADLAKCLSSSTDWPERLVLWWLQFPKSSQERKLILILCLYHVCYYPVDESMSNGQATSVWNGNPQGIGREGSYCSHICKQSIVFGMEGISLRILIFVLGCSIPQKEVPKKQHMVF